MRDLLRSPWLSGLAWLMAVLFAVALVALGIAGVQRDRAIVQRDRAVDTYLTSRKDTNCQVILAHDRLYLAAGIATRAQFIAVEKPFGCDLDHPIPKPVTP